MSTTPEQAAVRHVRVLMLGWEYPPRFAGGMGKACQGLAQAMARKGAQIFFVLPTFPERRAEPGLEVVGARETLIEAGWRPPGPRPTGSSAPNPEAVNPAVQVIRSEARLLPYGTPPQDGAPERLQRLMQGAPAASPSEPAESESREIYGENLWSEIERFCVSVRLLAGSHEVDVVHAHDWMTFPAAFEFHRVTGAPVFLHVHATEYDRSGESPDNDVFRIEREGFRRATHVFAVSRYTAGIIERLYGISGSKISVVHNAPEDEAAPRARAREKSEEPRKEQVVFLGRLTFQKGPDHFLRAAALVARANASARFLICGTGELLESLRQQAHRLGIERRVHFAGFVPPSGVEEILRRSTVLVMPSVSEPFGLVALEAIRCGLPVILSKQSGVREVLPRALQVDFWDHERLADQILASLRLPGLARQLVSEGRELIQALSWERSARAVLEGYRPHLGSTYFNAVEGAHGH